MTNAAVSKEYKDLNPGDRIGDREIKRTVQDTDSTNRMLVIFEDHSWMKVKKNDTVTVTVPEWDQFTQTVFNTVHDNFQPSYDIDKDLIEQLFMNAAASITLSDAGPPADPAEEIAYHGFAINRVLNALELIFYGELSVTRQMVP